MSSPARRRRYGKLLLLHGPFCSICGRLMLLGTHSIDHKLPIYFGGMNRLENLALAHRACNEAKGHQLDAA